MKRMVGVMLPFDFRSVVDFYGWPGNHTNLPLTL